MLQTKFAISSIDDTGYTYVSIQDNTGSYDATTNPGGYGTPNPLTNDITKQWLREEYLGDASPKGWELITAFPGGNFKWVHGFREGVTKISVLSGVPVSYVVTAFQGNSSFQLTNASALLQGIQWVEIGGVLYELDPANMPDSTTAYIKGTFSADATGMTFVYYAGYVYLLLSYQGYNALMKDIARTACTSLDCDDREMQALLMRFRMMQAIQPNFDNLNYSKAHNLAIALSPEFLTSKCASC